MILNQFFIFVLIGFISTVADILVIYIGNLIGAHYFASVTVGFIAGTAVNYLLHTRVTFKTRWSYESLIKFNIILIWHYLLTVAFILFTKNYYGSVMLGKLLSLPVVAVSGFLFGKYWIFLTKVCDEK